MATAGRSGSGDSLLRHLTRAGWTVDIRPGAGGVSALAVRTHVDQISRVAAWAKNPSAVAVLLYHAACATPPRDSSYS